MIRALLLAALLAAAPALAHDGAAGIAATPPGGVSWEVLTGTVAEPWQGIDGVTHLRPRFPAAVEALDGREVTIAGFPLAIEDDRPDAGIRHLALYANAQDCMLGLPPGPTHYVDVTLAESTPLKAGAVIVRGILELVRADRGGVFFRMHGARVLRG